MVADMDIVMAIQNLVQRSGKNISFFHVMGHADKKKEPADITRLERQNISCDEEANACVERNNEPTPIQPLPGARCMLKIKNRWIGTRPDKAVQEAFSKGPLEEYIKHRLQIDDEALSTLEYKHFEIVRSTHRWARLIRESKRLFGWLPVGHNWRHHGADNDKCPCCGEPDETFIHLLQCKTEEMRNLRREAFINIGEQATKSTIPRQVYKVAVAMLRAVCDQLPEESIDIPPPMERVYQEQCKIGLHNFAIGWFTKSWAIAMEHYGSKDPSTSVAQLLTLIWDGLCEPIWELRNNILHHKPNPTVLREMTNLRDRLKWYQRNKQMVIAPRHFFLTTYTDANIKDWQRDQCRAQLKLLEKAQQIFEIECRQRISGQQVLTDYFHSN